MFLDILVSVLGGSFSLPLDEEFVLFVLGLESTVSVFGGGIDELKVDGSVGFVGSGSEDSLSEDKVSLPFSDAASLDHDVVVSDFSVVREASEGGDVLLGQIGFSGSVVVDLSGGSADSVDSLVHVGSVMVTELTSSGNGPSDSLRMP